MTITQIQCVGGKLLKMSQPLVGDIPTITQIQRRDGHLPKINQPLISDVACRQVQSVDGKQLKMNQIRDLLTIT